MREEVLRMEHIYVKRRGTFALRDFKLNIYKGEMVIAFGFSGNGLHELGYTLSGKHADSGRMLVGEREINIRRDYFPEQNGIFVVHNRNNLVPDLTVAENLFLGDKKNMFAMPVSPKKQEVVAQSVADQFGLDIDVRKKAGEYQEYYIQMMIKLMKAYVKGAKLVVINEILEIANTKVQEKFFEIVRFLQKDGIAVLWISQRLDSIQELADRIVVVRDGQCVKNFYRGDFSREKMLRAAAESRISASHSSGRKVMEIGEELFSAENLMEEVSFSVHKNQIVGIWSEQAEKLSALCQIMSGHTVKYSGIMKFNGRRYAPKNHQEAVELGVQYIDFMWPERHYLPDMSVVDNLQLGNYRFFGKRHFLINGHHQKFMKQQYQMTHPDWPVKYWRNLTPDQQRILLYERCMNQPEKMILIVEPFTRVNYYLAEEIVEIFHRLQENGKTLILFSMNYMELSRVCDQIYQI